MVDLPKDLLTAFNPNAGPCGPDDTGVVEWDRVPNPSELCTMVVGSDYFDKFESVWIQRVFAEAYPEFRFTTADITDDPNAPPPNDWKLLQFAPGQECAIYLGGILTITGIIIERQTAYDKQSKNVQLRGVGASWYAARSGIEGDTNFDKMNFLQIADRVLAPTGISYCTVGNINPEPFKQMQAEPSETIWAFLERIARVRGIILGSDNKGHFVFIDSHQGEQMAVLREGDNILKLQSIISIQNVFSHYYVDNQSVGNDQQHMMAAAQMRGEADGSLRHYSIYRMAAETPVWGKGELDERARFERLWHEGTFLEVNVTVQGWFRPEPPARLWAPGYSVWLDAPMAALPGIPLVIRTVTYMQDNEGTRTELLLVPPWAMKDKGWDVSPGVPSAFQLPTTPPPPVKLGILDPPPTLPSIVNPFPF